MFAVQVPASARGVLLCAVIVLSTHATALFAGPKDAHEPPGGPRAGGEAPVDTAVHDADLSHPGSLWVLGKRGTGKLNTYAGRFQFQFPEFDGMQAAGTDAATGTVWLYGDGELVSISRDGEVQSVHALVLPGDQARALAVDHVRQQLWIAVDDNVFCVDTEGQVLVSFSTGDDDVISLSLDTERGIAWFATPKRLQAVDAESRMHVDLPYQPRSRIQAIAFDHGRDRVWVAGNDGARWYTPDGVLGNAMPSPVQAHPLALGVDENGSTWFASEQEVAVLDAAGTTLGSVRPFSGRGAYSGGKITGLFVDSWDHTAWVTNQRWMLRIDATGNILNAIEYRDGNKPGQILAAALHYDTTLPEIALHEPQPGIFTNDNTPAIAATWSDFGSAVDPESVAFTVDGRPLAAQCESDTEKAQCEATDVIPDGYVTLSADVADLAFNRAKPASVSFTVDTIPPKFVTLKPADEFLTNEPAQIISGSFDEPVSLTINGTEVVAPFGEAFSHPVTLEEGENVFDLIATDRADNVTQIRIVYTLDTLPPEIRITSPAAGAVTTADSAAVSGSVNETAAVQVNEKAAAVDGMNFSSEISLTEGANAIRITATDLAGNTGFANASIERDTTPPPVPSGASISIVQTDTGLQIVGAPGSVEPFSEVEILVNSSALSAAGISATALPHGYSSLVRVRADANGAFVINITEPVDPRDLLMRLIDRGGNFSDPIGLPEPAEATRTGPVGTLAGQFSVDQAGAANYRIPIAVPRGTAGMQPDLALLYSSRAGNGNLGVGWSLSGLSAVMRCGKTIRQDGEVDGVGYDKDDRFCLDGQRLVKIGSGAYGGDNVQYRTEIESFQKVTSFDSNNNGVPEKFEVRDKAGLIREYGYTADSRVNVQGKSTPLMWALTRIKDRNSNYILFEYHEDTGSGELGEHYLKEVSWYNNRDQRIGRVVLRYENRDDKVFGYLPGGGKSSLTKRVEEIAVYAGADLARSYKLDYKYAPFSGLSVIDAIRLCGSDGKCLPGTRFGWQHPEESQAKYQWLSGANVYITGDVDGDGLVDLIYPREDRIAIRFGKSSGQIKDTGIRLYQDRCIVDGCDSVFGRAYLTKMRLELSLVGDFDGDGYQDLLIPHLGTGSYWWLRGSENGLQIAMQEATPLGSQSGDFEDRNNGVTDLDADGASEALIKHRDRLKIVRYDGSEFRRWDAGIPVYNSQKLIPLDANGDGKSDLYVTRGSCNVVSNPDPGDGGELPGGGYCDPDTRICYDPQMAPQTEPLLSPQSCSLDPYSQPLMSDLVSPEKVDVCDPGGGGGGGGGSGGDTGGDTGDDFDNVTVNPCASSGVLLSTGDGFELPSSRGPIAKHPVLIDANGDGLTDILSKESGAWRLYVNNGQRWNVTSWSGGDTSDKRLRALDWNGDGKQDLMVAMRFMENPFRDVWAVMLSNGDSFDAPERSGFNDGAHDDRYRSAQFVDVTGDGIADLLYTDGENVGTVRRPNDISQSLLTGVTDGLGSETIVGYGLLSLLGDAYLGDTQRGLNTADRNDPAIRDLKGPLPVVTFFAQDTGRAIANGNGAKVVTSYQYAGAKVDIHGRGFLGFAEVHASNANTGIDTLNYLHQSFPLTGMVSRAEQRRHRNSTPVDIDNDRLREDYFPGCISVDPRAAMLDDCVRKTFAVPDRMSTMAVTDGQLVSRMTTDYLATPHGKRVVVVTRSTDDRRYDFDSANIFKRVRSTYSYDDYGNPLTASVTTDNGKGGDVHVISTQNSYTNDTSRWILGRLRTSTVTHDAPNAPSIARHTEFTYDPQTGQLLTETLEPGDAKLAVTTTYVPDDFGNIEQQTVSSTATGVYGVEDRTSITKYDAKGVYAVQRTNALGHDEYFTWDARYDAEISIRNADGEVTRAFDGFGRLKAETAPRQDLRSTVSYAWCGGASPCHHESGVYQKVRTTTTGQRTVVELDRLGREVYSFSRGLGSEYVAKETWYDLLGRVYLESNPYRFDDPVVCYVFREFDSLNRVTREHRAASEGECDRRGDLDVKRLYSHTTAPKRYSNITEFTYSQLTTTVTQSPAAGVASGQQRVTTRVEDVVGQTQSVTEFDDRGQAAVTRFAYTSTGEPRYVTPPSGKSITFTYDRRGRKTSMTDPDMGQWTYVNNALGELVRQTDAKGQVVELEYDKLGRLVRRSEAEGETRWQYDAPLPGAEGKLAVVEGPDGFRERYRYTEKGELQTTLRQVDGLAFFTHRTFDRYGRLRDLYYPAPRDIDADDAQIDAPDLAGAFRLRHGYSSSGTLAYIQRADGVADTRYWQAEKVNSRGNVVQASLGNGLSESAHYDAADGLVREMGIGPGANRYTRQYLTYQWDTAGNLLKRRDELAGIQESFEYDRLYRLSRTQLRIGAYTGSQSFDYDIAGNITRKGGYRNFQYGEGADGSIRPHAVMGVDRYAGGEHKETLEYLYDENGNADYAAGRDIDWTSYNKPSRISKDGASSTFAYGPDRARYRHVKTYVNGDIETTHYAGLTERVEKDQGTASRVEYRQSVAVGGRVVAVVTDYAASGVEQTRYLHRDHLGSVVLVTNESGRNVEERSYDAWGATVAKGSLTPNVWSTGVLDNIATPRGFTDHEMLDHLGLIHMNGRIYDPLIGRFLSADSIVQFPESTQGYNRYTYVNNNPLNATDPDGHRASGFGEFLSKIAPLLNFIPGCQVWCAGIASAVGGYLQTGSGSAGLKSGILMAWSSAAGQAIGGAIGGDTFGAMMGRAFASGVVGGLMSHAGGGRFGDGFLGGFFGSLGGEIGPTGNIGGDMLVGAIVGGTASVIGGGKFANGAVSGAFSAATRSQRYKDKMHLDAASAADVTPGQVDPNGPLSHREVRKEMKDAWDSSMPGSPMRREQGGWIVRYKGLSKFVRSILGMSDVAVVRVPPGTADAIMFGREPVFGEVIGKFHTHPSSDFPVGSIPNDLFNTVPAYVIASGGVTRINLDNTQNYLGPIDKVLSY